MEWQHWLFISIMGLIVQGFSSYIQLVNLRERVDHLELRWNSILEALRHEAAKDRKVEEEA